MSIVKYACNHCGFWQDWFDKEAPTGCKVDEDYRNSLPADGFTFLTPSEVGERLTTRWQEVAPGVTRFWNEPTFGIGLNSFLVEHDKGNVMFEGADFYSEAALGEIKGRGGLAFASASHPHAYGALWQLTDAFGVKPMLHRGDAEWTRSFAKDFYDGDRLPLGETGLTLHHTAGHFAGHAVLHDENRKLLFCGDALKPEWDRFDDPNRELVGLSCHLAFPLATALARGDVERYAEVIGQLAFDGVGTSFEFISGVTTEDVVYLYTAELSASLPSFEGLDLRSVEVRDADANRRVSLADQGVPPAPTTNAALVV